MQTQRRGKMAFASSTLVTSLQHAPLPRGVWQCRHVCSSPGQREALYGPAVVSTARSVFLGGSLPSEQQRVCSPSVGFGSGNGSSVVAMTGAPLGGKGKKPSRSRRMRNQGGDKAAAAAKEKTKLEPETVFLDTPPSRLELIVPTISILTVVGILPFTASVARALWVRYKITSRRISIASGFQGKDQTEIIYRDIDQVKYVRRLGDSADVVITLKDGAKLEIRAIPQFDSVYEYIMSRVDESVRDASGPA